MQLNRCSWAESNELLRDYHDKEWGVVQHDDNKLFEFLNLEGAQAGLSWLTILKRRDGYIKAFDNFNPNKIKNYDDKKIASLLNDPGIIRNRLKVNAVIENSKAYLKIKKNYGSLDKYLWQFTGNKTLTRKDHVKAEQISNLMSKELKSRGFKFVGPTICYAFMQATGMINDHAPDCYRYEELKP
ncbi:MAG: DNA-3-methyladenine glycosylase I [Candidatus Saccharibacteria bacterium]